MSWPRRGWGAVAVLALLAAPACDRTPDGDPPPAGAPPAAEVAAPDTALADTALAAVVRRTGDGRYALHGRTRATDVLQVSVEDGHFILYGPAEVPVREGVFRTEFQVAPAGMSTVYVYLADPGGAHQWVIPLPVDSPRVHWGPGAERLPDPTDP